MKRFILSLAILLFAAVSFASTVSTEVTTYQQEEKVKIKAEELPDAVKEKLQSDAYKAWTIVEVYHVKTSDQYEVEVKNDAETKTLKFDKSGNVIE